MRRVLDQRRKNPYGLLCDEGVIQRLISVSYEVAGSSWGCKGASEAGLEWEGCLGGWKGLTSGLKISEGAARLWKVRGRTR